MSDIEAEYIAFYDNGTKVRINASSDEEAREAALEEADGDTRIEFITHIGSDLPCDYDWDSELKMWQSRMF